MIGYIYRITNIKNGKCYVGITEHYTRRRNRHISELKNKNHHSPKLQAAWDYYGEENFEWTVREVEISKYDELYELEILEIKKYNSYEDGYNCNSGGKISDWRQKVNNEDMIDFLCVQWVYGDGYGKTFEEICHWARGTASAGKRKIRYLDANCAFEKMPEKDRQERGRQVFEKYELGTKSFERILKHGGCEKAYQLKLEDYYFAFAAQELGFGYSQVATVLGVKPTTVKDWFNGRSRKKERDNYSNLSKENKKIYFEKVKQSEIETSVSDKLVSKNEKDLIAFLCYDKFFPQQDSNIQRFFNWSEGTCYSIRDDKRYSITKLKFNKLTENQQKEIAENLKHLLIGPV